MTLYLISVIMAIFLIAFNIIDLKNKKYVYIVTFLISLVILVLNAMMIFGLDNAFLKGMMPIYDFIFAGIFGIYTLLKLLKIFKLEKDYQDVLASINNSENNVYLLLDAYNKVQEISDILLREFGLNKKQIKHKDFYEILDKKVRVTLSNNLPSSNKTLRNEAEDYKAHYYEKHEEKREITFQNVRGESVSLNLTVRPIVEKDKYLGRVFIGSVLSNMMLAGLERDLIDKNKDIRSIQKRFVATISETKEGLFFYNRVDDSIWGNDNWKKELGLSLNNLSFYDFKARIHQDDVPYYLDKINKLDKDNSAYEIRYRFLIDGRYHYIYEHGTLVLDEGGENIVVGFADRINDNFFEYTGHKEIDNLKTMVQLNDDLEILLNKGYIFQLVAINLTSLPEINAEFGRNIGNIMMVEYLKKLRESFQTESSNIYRASGLLFYLTITDPRKMELFKRSIISYEDAMNMHLNIGSQKVTLKVNIGVCESKIDGNDKEALLNNVLEAINYSMNPNYVKNYVYYREIKEKRIG